MHKNLTTLRLEKEESSLKADPIPGVIVRRQGHLNFHFCLYDMQEEYKGGVYHGLLELHENYPFSPPKLKFFTPNGRFQPNQSICTSFTNYHKESWSAVWNVKSLITATISFMHSGEIGKGGMRADKETRQELAKKSLQRNMQNQTFVKLFATELKEKGILKELAIEEKLQMKQQTNSPNQSQQQLSAEIKENVDLEQSERAESLKRPPPELENGELGDLQKLRKKKIHLSEPVAHDLEINLTKQADHSLLEDKLI